MGTTLGYETDFYVRHRGLANRGVRTKPQCGHREPLRWRSCGINPQRIFWLFQNGAAPAVCNRRREHPKQPPPRQHHPVTLRKSSISSCAFQTEDSGAPALCGAGVLLFLFRGSLRSGLAVPLVALARLCSGLGFAASVAGEGFAHVIRFLELPCFATPNETLALSCVD
jgi:hypothetical protein